jgi:glutathione synthase/RimK-type ligase-like ATP-grasp enzyme
VALLIGLTTTPAARDLDEDYAPLAAALDRLGFTADAPAWDDPAVDWRRYALVLLRSTWNYTEDLDAFLDWATRVSRVTRLLNGVDTVRWSTDKRYLLELDRAGVPIVPSAIAAPGEAWSPPAAADFVVKPSVGAGSRGARRFHAHETEAARTHALRLHAAGYHTLTQPYLHSVESNGETALMFIEGEFSHGVRKGPLLALGGAEVEGLFATETIEPRRPGADELSVANRAVAAIPGEPPLYARVDLIRDDTGRPRLLELELAEPTLFFSHGPGSADRFARAVAARLGL